MSDDETRATLREARRGVTIADVARVADVSLGTVSNVLNGTRPVSPDRRERVQRAMEQLGYQPNLYAQGLRRGRNGIVGVCVPHVANTYFMRLVDVFERLSVAQGFETVHVYARRDADHLREKIDWLIKFKVGGLIMLPSIDARDTVEAIARSSIPAVIIDRPIDDTRFDQVVTDAAGAMERIINGLVARGHRNVLFVTASRAFLVTRVRTAGLERAQAALPGLHAKVIEVGQSEDGVEPALAPEFMRDDPPTAIVVGSARIAELLFRALRRLGPLVRRWPAIVSFDSPEWADLSSPPISVVRPPVEAISALAWELLVRRMRGVDKPPEHHLLAAEVDLGAAWIAER